MREIEVRSMKFRINVNGNLITSCEIAVGEEIELYEDENGKLQSRKVNP